MEPDIQSYQRQFPKYPPPVKHEETGWVHGVWMIGQNFRSKHGYYGEYPPSFLRRVHALFPQAESVLHLFAGTVEKGLWQKGLWGQEITFDLNTQVKPDVAGDAHHLSEYFDEGQFDLIVADPPYTNEDAENYGAPMVSRNKVVRQCYPILQPGGIICWLDQVYPMHRKDIVQLIGTIGIWRSTNHRFRGLSIFRKL